MTEMYEDLVLISCDVSMQHSVSNQVTTNPQTLVAPQANITNALMAGLRWLSQIQVATF